jgi:hypothetical protein
MRLHSISCLAEGEEGGQFKVFTYLFVIQVKAFNYLLKQRSKGLELEYSELKMAEYLMSISKISPLKTDKISFK